MVGHLEGVNSAHRLGHSRKKTQDKALILSFLSRVFSVNALSKM